MAKKKITKSRLADMIILILVLICLLLILAHLGGNVKDFFAFTPLIHSNNEFISNFSYI